MRSAALLLALLALLAVLPAAAAAAPDAPDAPRGGGAPPTLTAEATDGPLTARLSVTPARPAPGTPVDLVIVAAVAADVGADPTVAVAWPDVLGALTTALGEDVVEVESARVAADGRSFVARLRFYDEGAHALPPLPVRVTRGGERLAEVSLEGVTLQIDVDVPADAEPAPARDALPLVVPPPPVPWTLLGAAALMLAAIVVAVFLWRRRARAAAPPPPPVAAHEKALAALRSLAARALPEHGEVEPYFVALSEILRSYLEDRFGLRAPEQTTEEFLAEVSQTAAGRRAIEGAHRDVLREFLTRADLVKFARARPAEDECAAAGRSAEQFVTDTADIAPSATDADGRAHARERTGTAPRAPETAS